MYVRVSTIWSGCARCYNLRPLRSHDWRFRQQRLEEVNSQPLDNHDSSVPRSIGHLRAWRRRP